jgi:fused signal recognition particle receptor
MFGFLRRFRRDTSTESTKDELSTELPVDTSSELVVEYVAELIVEPLPEPVVAPVPVPRVESVVALVEPAQPEMPQLEDMVVEKSEPEFEPEPEPEPAVEPMTEPVKKPSLWASLRSGLARTREGLTEGLASLVLGKKQIDDDLLEELETRLLLADVGMETTRTLMNDLTQQVKRKDLNSPEALLESLYQHMVRLLERAQQPLRIQSANKPMVILVVGINGAGKTTTIGKLGQRLHGEGHKVILAAGDTFRAAAVEQLQAWGERVGVPVIAQASGADSAGVIYDALQAAQARKVDVLIADTAGRLHTQGGLMEELKKVKRVLTKLDADAPHEVLLVLDASIGQNALNQATHFHQALGVTGLVVTKLDGTAKAGILFAVTQQLGLPIRFIGVGEKAEDLRPFVARDFVNAILDRDE